MSDNENYPSTATWGGMITLKHRLTVYCEPCNRSVEIDMASFPPEESAIGRVFRCSLCGGVGRRVVSAPGPGAPSLGNDFYGAEKQGPRTEPLIKRRSRRR
jgi:hypothetical protein